MVPSRPALAAGLVTSAALLVGSVPAGAAGAPVPTPAAQQLRMAWAAPRLSVSTPAEQVVAEGAANEDARTANGGLRVVSVRAMDGRPEVSSKTVPNDAAAVREVAARQRDRGVVSVEIDVPRKLEGTPADATPTEGTAAEAATAAVASDPYRREQWAMDAVRAEHVWPRSTGEGVVIAVLDTGVDAHHPDLQGRVSPGAAFPRDGRPGTSPVNAHGTHVAGIAVATADNGTGIAGVAPKATVLPVRVFDEAGRAEVASLVDGIVYATDQGADVINMSYTTDESSDAERIALQYARGKGVTLVAAAGNFGQSMPPDAPIYPAAYDGVIGVSNEGPDGRTNPITNKGTFVDVSAPGTDILSTVPGTGYDRMTGTSMATPVVSGVAALLLSAEPRLTPDQVEQALTSTAVDMDAPGYDTSSGFGRVSSPEALDKSRCILDGGCAPAQNPLSGNRNQAMVNRAYATLFGRNAAGADLWSWNTRFAHGATPTTLAIDLTSSTEFRQRFLVGAYDRYLQRSPGAAELSGWSAAMRAGRTQPQVEAAFLGSTEFYLRNGRTNTGFITGLYRNVLGRTPSQAEVDAWNAVINRGASRTDVALGFTQSPEYQAQQVDAWYRKLIGRGPNSAELTSGVSHITSGGRVENVIATIMNSWEFRSLSGQRFGSTGLRLRTSN